MIADVAPGGPFAVFVWWKDAPGRAERLGNGETVTRKAHASMFPTREAATTAGEQATAGIEGVERWEVRPW